MDVVAGAANPTVIDDGGADQTRDGLVKPPNWQNPTPAARYDLVVLGGGTAGLVSAMGAAGLGARVALVERQRLGGDCLNTGCVPSKALVRSARVVGEIRRARALGVAVSVGGVDFDAVMQRMRRRRALIAKNDSVERLQGAGVDVFFGTAHFGDRRTVAVNGGTSLRFRRAVIATGGRPTAPPIPGLASVPFLTNETVFDVRTLPRRLLVIGAGPVGCELSQAFARFGSEVTLFDQAPQILPTEDTAAAAIVQRHLESDGIRLELGVRVLNVDRSGDEFRIQFSKGVTSDAPTVLSGDSLLVAAGRAPNIDTLDLDAAGVDASATGVTVNDRLQTTNPRVFASGDVCSRYKFTHAADAMSRIVLQNALFYGRRKASALVIPWVTYTGPELAHVGVGEADVQRSHGRLKTITVDLTDIDRAVLDDASDGFVRVHHEGGRLRGCTIVAPHAGEMIGEAAYALTHRGTLAALSTTVHPYPTMTQAFGRAGDVYRRQSLTPSLRLWLGRYFRWTR